MLPTLMRMATMPLSRTKRRNAPRKIQTIKSPVERPGFFVWA